MDTFKLAFWLVFGRHQDFIITSVLVFCSMHIQPSRTCQSVTSLYRLPSLHTTAAIKGRANLSLFWWATFFGKPLFDCSRENLECPYFDPLLIYESGVMLSKLPPSLKQFFFLGEKWFKLNVSQYRQFNFSRERLFSQKIYTTYFD